MTTSDRYRAGKVSAATERGDTAESVTQHNFDQIALWCVKCWTEMGPRSRPWQGKPAVIVSQGQSLCEDHARTTYDAVWG